MRGDRNGLRGGLFSLALGLAIGLGGAAHAQTQTAANAQKFLSVIAGQQTSRVDVASGGSWNQTWGKRTKNKCTSEYYYDFWGTRQGPRTRCWDEDDSRNISGPSPLLTGATPITDCLTEITYRDDSTYFDGYTITALGEQKTRIDWSKVAKVQQDGATVLLSPNLPMVRFRLSSDDLAKRAAFAMEFLRQTCDAAAATGF